MIPQLSFLSPDRLLILLVIPLLVAAYIFATRRKNRRGMRFTNTSMLDVVVPKQSQWRRHLAVALSLLSLVTLTAAFAQPSTQIDVPRERATVVIVIDASQSMQATDVAPNRLAAAKAAAIEFVQKIPDKYNVSVVSMAGNSSILVPPTLAHNTVENAINSIQLQDGDGDRRGHLHGAARPAAGAEGPEQARLGRARGHRHAHRRLQHRRPAPRCRPRPKPATAKVPIYTIAYGTENGYVDLDGKREPVPVDHELMKQIAAATQRPVLRRSLASTS